MERETTVSDKIVFEVSRAEGVDPLDLDPLYEVIDTDALDSLFQSPSGSLSVTFEYAGYEVRVEDPEEIEVTETKAHSLTEP